MNDCANDCKQIGNEMSQIGVLFDIDDLGGGSYGYAAYKLLFDTLGTDLLRECELSDGDTSETLCGSARHYCIAIETGDAAKRDAIQQAVLRSKNFGFVAVGSRIIEGDAVSRHPLVQAGFIDSAGQIKGCDTAWIVTAWQQCGARSVTN